ncbi:hypothetical protein Tco_1191794 [Tanacetum coccineum]
MKAGFLDPGGGGKKNNKHGVQATGKKKNNTNGVDNTTGSCGFGLVSGFSPFVDVTGTIHVQEGDLKDGTSLMGEVWVKFHDVLLVAYTSDGLSLIASNPNDADSFTNSMCLESWAIIWGYSGSNIEGSGYTKETIHVEYEWEPPRCSKGRSSGADDDGFIKVKNKKSSRNNGGTKNFRPISMKQMPRYRLKPTREASPKIDPPANMKKVSIPVEQWLLDWKCVLLDDEDKLVKRTDYTSDRDSDDEVEFVDNDMARFLASNPLRAVYGTNSLLE